MKGDATATGLLVCCALLSAASSCITSDAEPIASHDLLLLNEPPHDEQAGCSNKVSTATVCLFHEACICDLGGCETDMVLGYNCGAQPGCTSLGLPADLDAACTLASLYASYNPPDDCDVGCEPVGVATSPCQSDPIAPLCVSVTTTRVCWPKGEPLPGTGESG